MLVNSRVGGGWLARRSMPWMASAAVLVTLAALLPLAFVVWMGIESGWATVSALIFRPRVGELLINTSLLVIFTVPLCTLLGVALAWLTERIALPGARLWAWLAVAPLAVPAFVHGYAWVSVAPGLHGLLAGVMVSASRSTAALIGVFWDRAAHRSNRHRN